MSAILLLGAVALADPPPLTVSWGTGVEARLGKGAVFVGAGGGPSLSATLAPTFEVNAEARWLWLAGSTGLGRLGFSGFLERGDWRPRLGLEVTVYVEPSLRAVTVEDPTLASPVAPALQLRVDALRFASGSLVASALRLDVGFGWSRGAAAPAFGLTLVDVGMRL